MPIVLAAEEVWAPEVSQEDMLIFVMKNLESILFSDVHHTVVHLVDCCKLHGCRFSDAFPTHPPLKDYFVTGSYCWQTLNT